MDVGENEIKHFLSIWAEFSAQIAETTSSIADHIALLNNATNGWVSKETVVKNILGPEASKDAISDETL